MEKVCVKLRAGMERNGTKPEVIEAVTKAVQSFAVYGFPESHAISFAILAYASCWLKVHRAAEFFAGLLNNQPMGFYSPATLVADAKRHGVRIKPVSVLESDWFCVVEGDDILRLGLCYVRGLRREDGERIVAERQKTPFASLVDFQLRTALLQPAARGLAKIGALNGLAEHRRDAQWKVEVSRDPDDLFARVENEAALPLVQMNPVERLRADYSGTGLSVGLHPMKLIRSQLPEIRRASDLQGERNGTLVKIAGQVICRQRPGTAKGFVFVSLEDETGVANAIVTPQLFERYRLLITEEPFLLIVGVMQNVDNVIHVKAGRIEALQFRELMLPASHDFR
jgi:error-prone DNA polymerase